MGFGLYINSRVETEGWDLQLLFQKFSGAAVSKPVIKTVLAACFFIALFFGPQPFSAFADYFPSEFPQVPGQALDNLNKILSSKDFGEEKKGWSIQFRDFDEPEPLPDLNLVPWLEKIRRIFGYGLRFFAILAIAAFFVFAVYWLRKYYRKPDIGKGRDKRKIYGSHLLHDAHPESLFAIAEEYFVMGFIREAWAACFSGCVEAYSRYRSLSFPADATEYGCLKLVSESLPEHSAGSRQDEMRGFAELVNNWILFAYGGRAPENGAFERALSFGRSIREP